MSKIKSTKSKLDPSKTTFGNSGASQNGDNMLFNKTNYYYILGGIGLMVIGFILMSGGQMPSPEVWDESIIYSTRRTLIAPIFILAGLVVQVYAIFKK